MVEPEDVELDDKTKHRWGNYIQFEEIDFDVAGEIMQVLRKYNLNQVEFARITGLPRPSVTHWLSGRLPHRSVYRKIYRGSDAVHSHKLEKPRGSSVPDRMTALTALEEGSTQLQEEKPQLQNVRFADMTYNKVISKTDRASKDIEGACSKCPLKNEAFVDGEGSGKILIIGEGPGEEEADQGRPFVGAAGRELDKLLSLADIDRSTETPRQIQSCQLPFISKDHKGG